jgi:hypothetical protein
MITKGDTEMNTGWGRVLIGIGVIIAFLALGALEVLTARLPAGGDGLVGQANSDNGSARTAQDYLDVRGHVTSREPDAASLDERSEAGRAVAAADGVWRLP